MSKLVLWEYYDDLVRKRSTVSLTLHESIGGSSSPPATARLHNLSPEWQRPKAGDARTRYSARCRLSLLSYLCHHSQRSSLSIVEADSAALLHSSRRLVASLQRM